MLPRLAQLCPETKKAAPRNSNGTTLALKALGWRTDQKVRARGEELRDEGSLISTIKAAPKVGVVLITQRLLKIFPLLRLQAELAADQVHVGSPRAPVCHECHQLVGGKPLRLTGTLEPSRSNAQSCTEMFGSS